ncbi:Aspartyl/asparaginy/proline hydroxylase [Trinorchestia longiramus]|nr:Aspartyl/asparaginy/proline hydroxylase [Trinorchestia longiramus]
MRLNNKAIKCSDRVKFAVQDFIDNSKEIDKSINKNACLRIDNLASHAFWNEFNAFDCEKKILLKNLPKIKEEFRKVFKDFQQGIYKHWLKVEVLNGHSCCFPLIKEGIINTTNCQACPATFQVLSECRVMGLSSCMFGSVSFTLLYPDSKVGPRSGLTNALIKCDVVLQSTTSGVLEVSGKKREWKEGEVFFYDSSQPHSASLASSKDMTVLATPLALLSLDLWHPELDTSERKALSLLFAS